MPSNSANVNNRTRRKLVSWHLDRKVTLSLIAVILLNSGSLIWGAAKISAQVDSLGNIPGRVTAMEEKIIRLETEAELMKGLMGEFKQTMTTFNNTLSRIDREQARRTPMVNHVENRMGKGK